MWKAGQKLDTKFDLVHGHHDLYFNPETGVLGVVTGMGIARATAATMALGLDPRFDLTHAYWLVAGIAGIDPANGSIGSAVWATWLVDGDLSHEIDAREIPTDWETGYFPLFSTRPDFTTPAGPVAENINGEVYKINPDLADWAYDLTKDLTLTDYPEMKAFRQQYVNYPNAQKAPFVLKGEHLAASTYWHGKLLTNWANDWVSYWTNGKGDFVTSGMEDTGTYQALQYLHAAGKVDKNRYMVVRTASNYSHPQDALTAAENIKVQKQGYVGMQSALESAYTVGSKVVDTIVANWQTMKTTMPYDVDSTRLANKQVSSDSVEKVARTVNARKLTTQELVDALKLEGHVEGGYYRQTFKADHRPKIVTEIGQRATMTSIYYLLSAESPIGHFHMNQSDIMHYFHAGDPITYYLIQPDGRLQTVVMGSDPTKGQVMQMAVKGGTWKASKIPTNGDYGYGLIGEAVAPSFEYSDMQLGETSQLIAQFPQHGELIKILSR
ncbi:cupin domain-containing protein [Paraglaciecola aquimarina]|uniref:Cupin domain-containing protein n=1 Tax=Paraglaciecola aquimarina TaxID=1235557 RepID=A0ABU3SYH7_9ALTE|nr:cupin domain-containing protein [Paraglaciecola aquimarina]MDU0355055.1 cupin domain-containing protein [Paraglaciecola aquimarina]